MLNDWIIDKLNRVKKQQVVIVADSLHILSQTDQKIQAFAEKNGYIVIFSSTNLVFRELLEHAREDPLKKKILLVDQTPIERRGHQTTQRAPPLFYPDFFPGLPDEAFIRVDLQTFLKEKTGDPNWPKEANERQYARLILKYLSGVLDAYKQLRDADKKRFTDQDFRTIVAFAALGLGKKAFQKLEYGDYWKIVFANHEEFKEIGTINHQILSDIKIHLEQAPKPFCWFATHDPDVVIRSLYLALVLSQYREDWRILLGNIDPEARLFSDISNEDLEKAARNLIDANADVADSDLGDLEDSFTNDDLRTLLIDWLHIDSPTGFSEMLQKEKYSLLLRSFALMMAIGDVLSAKPDIEAHKSIQEVLFGESIEGEKRFVDERKSTGWGYLKEAYWLATEVQSLKQELAQSLRHARTVQANKLDFNYFWNIWNVKRTNRIEYYLSRLERTIHYGDDILLPRSIQRVPPFFIEVLSGIKEDILTLTKQTQEQLDELNTIFQRVVKRDYPGWIKGNSDVVLTAQFIHRCVKPHWDPEKERAVILIFDGMRYDIWDEILRPLVLDYLQEKTSLKGCALIPSETHISRKALSAGTFPDQFSAKSDSENKLLQEALKREFGLKEEVKKVDASGLGIGETVRYHTKNLDMFIFDLCDTELHRINMKEVSGRLVPDRPLVLLYQQQLKDIIEREVMATIRGFEPKTKIFITADHGFGRVGRDKIWFRDEDVNEVEDCQYLQCKLQGTLGNTSLPNHLLENIIEFPIDQVRLPAKEERTDKRSGAKIFKKYGSLVFPKPGFAFARPGGFFNPPAFSHGGISIQELLIPMVVLEVRPSEKDMLTLEFLEYPQEVVEGEEVTIRLLLKHTGKTALYDQELPIDLDASFSSEPGRHPLPSRRVYIPLWGQKEVPYRFEIPLDEATLEERMKGMMTRTFTVIAHYREKNKMGKKTLSHQLVIKLNTERIVRRVGGLGNILGLTPKGDSSMKT